MSRKFDSGASTEAKAPAGPRTKKQPTGAVTMADVAARLGISKMTVSRALTRTSARSRGASEELRQRILSTSREMGYVIDRTASAFSSKRSGFVAVLIPSLNNSNFADTVHGLTLALEDTGLQVLFGYTDYDLPTEERLLRAMLTRRPEAVVLTGGSHLPSVRKMLKAAAVPVVEMWDMLQDPIEHTVGFSNAEATAELVRQLHAKGYRRMAFMGGTPERDPRGAERRQGFEAAVKELGLPQDRIVVVGPTPPVSMAHGAQAVVQVMQRWPDTDALVCVSDHPAFGALMECQRRGWAVPQRLAIAGFGSFEVSTACHPRLTTVVIDCAGIGRATGELLKRAITAVRNGKRLEAETVMIPFEIAQRESS